MILLNGFIGKQIYRHNLRSRGKRFNVSDDQSIGHKTSKTNAVDSTYNKQTTENMFKSSFEGPDKSKIKRSEEELCPQKCKTHHFLADCPIYQNLSVDERWEVIKRNNRCRKCLMTHHTNL